MSRHLHEKVNFLWHSTPPLTVCKPRENNIFIKWFQTNFPHPQKIVKTWSKQHYMAWWLMMIIGRGNKVIIIIMNHIVEKGNEIIILISNTRTFSHKFVVRCSPSFDKQAIMLSCVHSICNIMYVTDIVEKRD